VSILVIPAWQSIRFLRVPGRLRQVKKARLYVSCLLAVTVLLFFALLPLPHRVICTFVVQPRAALRVYVDVPGVLTNRLVRSGEQVEFGQRLAVLRNADIDYEVTRLQGEGQRTRLRLRSLRRQQGTATRQIPQTEAAIKAIEERLAELQRDRQRLTLTAQSSGTILPGPRPPSPAGKQTGSGTPLDEEYEGSWLGSGTLFCLVADPESMEAILVIDQSDVDYVATHQPVEFCFDEYPGATWFGQIDEIARRELEIAPRELTQAAGSQLPTTQDASGVERPSNNSYQARVFLANRDGRLMSGFRGRAKIIVGKRTVGSALMRYLARTIRF